MNIPSASRFISICGHFENIFSEVARIMAKGHAFSVGMKQAGIW